MNILLIVYDNNSYIHWFPQGTAYLASALRQAGHDVSIYNQDKYHYSEEHLKEHLKENKFDVVGLGFVAGYYQYRKVLKISKAIKSIEKSPYYILGGHGPSPEPEFFLKKTGADAVVMGEGEISTVSLVNALEKGEDIAKVNGVAFLNSNEELVVTEEQPLIEDIDSINFPAWDLFPMDYYSLLRLPNIDKSERCLPVLSSRGCPFECNFCYRMDKGYRLRSPEGIIEEIGILKDRYKVDYIAFSDELLMTSPGRTVELCEKIIEADLNIKWDCNGRLNYAKPEVLNIMKKAGCVFINYGIESVDDQVLKNMNKKLTVKQIIDGVEATLDSGISPGLNIIWGNIGDDIDTLNKGVDFLLKYDDQSQFRTIRSVTSYPGSELYYIAIEKGLLDGPEDFYENKHTNSDLLAVNFTDLTDEEFHKELFYANKRLIENYYDNQKSATLDRAKKLYYNEDDTFRGFRQS